MEKQSFPSAKTTDELNIDLSRHFEVVKKGGIFDVGEILTYLRESQFETAPSFENCEGFRAVCKWEYLAYAN
jgi:hypothetical protein